MFTNLAIKRGPHIVPYLERIIPVNSNYFDNPEALIWLWYMAIFSLFLSPRLRMACLLSTFLLIFNLPPKKNMFPPHGSSMIQSFRADTRWPVRMAEGISAYSPKKGIQGGPFLGVRRDVTVGKTIQEKIGKSSSCSLRMLPSSTIRDLGAVYFCDVIFGVSKKWTFQPIKNHYEPSTVKIKLLLRGSSHLLSRLYPWL